MTHANVLAQLGAQSGPTFRNRIINGAMVIDQRNAGASITANNATYAVDRFLFQASQSSKFTSQQNAGSVTPPAGFTNYLGYTSSSAYSIGNGDYFIPQQRIEGYNVADLGWGTANAKTVTLSFQVYSSLTGTFGGSIINSGSTTRSYPFSYTISSANTWTSISITIAGDGVAGAGQWGTTNSNGMIVIWGLGVGSTYSGTAGSWSSNAYFSATGATSVVGTNGATFYITGVQLEVGSSATGFEYVNYQTSLANCQRYFEVFSAGSGRSNSTTNQSTQAQFVVTKRATPTISIFGTGSLYDYGGTAYSVSSVGTTSGISTAGVGFLQINNASSGVGGGSINNGTTACFSASSEL